MANIKVNSPVPVYNGQPLTFRAPAACSAIGGLVVYYPDGDTTASRVFTLTDASGGNIGVLDNAFAKDAIVKVVLDTDLNNAFVQNPNTNTYLEGELAKKYSPNNKPTATDVGAMPKNSIQLKDNEDLNNLTEEGEYFYPWYNETIANKPVHSAFHLSVRSVADLEVTQTYTQYDGYANPVFVRQSTNQHSFWTEWKQLATTNYALPRDGSAAISAQGGPNGGRLYLEKPHTDSTIGGNVSVDANQNAVRFFEMGGSYRGAKIELPQCGPVDNTIILHTGNVTAGTTDLTAGSSALAHGAIYQVYE